MRDIASAVLTNGTRPIGLLSTAAQQFTNIARDLQKDQPFNREHAGRLIQDGSALIGLVTGMMPGAQVGRTARFATGLRQGRSIPRAPGDGWLDQGMGR